MAPFILLVSVFVVLALVGRGRWPWSVSLRIALAAMFTLTAWAHFGSMRADIVRMVPPAFPEPELIVTVTGVLELLGAIGLLVPRTSQLAAWLLAVLVAAMFPANVYAALEGITLSGRPPTPLVLRTILQLVFIGALIASALGERARRRTARRLDQRPPIRRHVLARQ